MVSWIIDKHMLQRDALRDSTTIRSTTSSPVANSPCMSCDNILEKQQQQLTALCTNSPNLHCTSTCWTGEGCTFTKDLPLFILLDFYPALLLKQAQGWSQQFIKTVQDSHSVQPLLQFPQYKMGIRHSNKVLS